MTQLEAARRGVITAEMRRVAQRECVTPELIRDEVARGRLVIERLADTIERDRQASRLRVRRGGRLSFLRFSRRAG